MTREEAKSLFTLAGIPVLNIKPLIDGYNYGPEDSRFYKTLPEKVWWFVKTAAGWVEIGWRRRVISINWSDTPVRKIVTEDNVTKDEEGVHAWDIATALKYLSVIAPELAGRAAAEGSADENGGSRSGAGSASAAGETREH